MISEHHPDYSTTTGAQRRSSSSRRSARELALQVLFQWDFHEQRDVGISEFWNERSVSPSVKNFARHLIEGVQEHCTELDTVIQRYAKNWSMERMQLVDRNILRLSVYELIWGEGIPARVTINEALELAKNFADDEARRFINGILDQIFQMEPSLEQKRQNLFESKSSDSDAK